MPSKYILILISFFSILSSCIRRDETQKPVEQDELSIAVIEKVDSARIAKCLEGVHISADASASVYRIYRENDTQAIWTDSLGMRPQASLAASFFWKYLSSGIIDSSIFLPGMHGLFDKCIGNQHSNPTFKDILDSEVLFTCQVVVFFESLLKVRKPSEIGQIEWYIPLRKNQLRSDLNWSSISAPEKLLEESPAHQQVSLLLKALERLIAIEQSGGWPLIPAMRNNISLGDTSSVIVALKHRLRITGAYLSSDTTNRFDKNLEDAIRKTRLSFGLTDSVLVDSILINRLNIPVSERIETVKVNLERWKWVPRDTADTMIQVNIAAFELEVVQNRKIIKRMPAIAGDTMHHTVMFYDELQQIVFSPYWNIPKSILAKEIWPDLRRDRGYLRRKHLEVVRGNKVIDPSVVNWRRYNANNFPYTIRQKPGNGNPLGGVKFVFPNPYSIYFHDTPNKTLFDKRIRSFSHGCIRIAEPAWLASYLLKGQQTWNASSIDSAMKCGKETFVNLPSPVPVHITYFTSWVDESGMLNFRDDVYGHDLRMLQVWKPMHEK
ncbi:MAG: L,D-transpeptidase family protein [Arcticibacter sp.]